MMGPDLEYKMANEQHQHVHDNLCESETRDLVGVLARVVAMVQH